MIKICDGCGRILEKKDPWWLVRIEVLAQPEVELEEGIVNIEEEIKKTFEEAEKRDEVQLEREIYTNFDFILCRRCWEIYLQNPLRLSPE